MKKWKKPLKIILAVLLSIIVVLGIVIVVYTQNYYHAEKEAVDALAGNDTVTVKEYSGYWMFSPTDSKDSMSTGYIYYPGGKVEEDSYAPLMEKLAEKGVTCFLMKMPLRLAVFRIDAADGLQEKYPELRMWYIGGHSLGGAMSTAYAAKHTDTLKGLILMGAYPTKDLSRTSLRMLSFYGSDDHVLNRTNFEESKKLAPPDSVYHEIAGGNHAYYGNYGEQKGDGKASISRDEQQNEVVDATLSWLGR